MKILIDIDDQKYKWIVENPQAYTDELHDAIRNGTPLPKGHGRLIDGDELKTLSYEVLIDTDNPNRADGLSACNGLVEEDIDLAPTIIEADTEESENE